jgi:hypothetical protein
MPESSTGPTLSRRRLITAAGGACLATAAGCLGPAKPQSGQLDATWGLPGSFPGRLFRPRGIAIDEKDLLYIVDMTPQIQVFTPDGELVRSW